MSFGEGFIYFEVVPPSRWRPSKRPVPFEKVSDVTKDIQEKENKEKENEARVAEKIISELDAFGIKCPRCGLKQVRAEKVEQGEWLFCLDCNYRWQENKK